MSQRTWSQMRIELYGPDGYKGAWVVDPGEGRTYGVDDVRQHIARVRNDPNYASSDIRLCEDGDTIVIGLFSGVTPRGGTKSGNDLDSLLG